VIRFSCLYGHWRTIKDEHYSILSCVACLTQSQLPFHRQHPCLFLQRPPQSVTLLLQGRGMNTNNYKIVHMFRQKGMWWEDVHNSSLCVTLPALRETSSWVAHRLHNAMAELLTQGWLHCWDLNKCASIHVLPFVRGHI
jgi:hypothetical protein